METKTLYTKYAAQAIKFDVDLDNILLLHHSKALNQRKYKRAVKLRKAYKMAHKVFKSVKTNNEK